jgi:hypothetical protein
MAIGLKKISPVELRSIGLNEKWLQEQIREDTTILGLGELEIIGKEHRQPSGGRIDFLMHHADTDLFYEVEIMLGTLDETRPAFHCTRRWMSSIMTVSSTGPHSQSPLNYGTRFVAPKVHSGPHNSI